MNQVLLNFLIFKYVLYFVTLAVWLKVNHFVTIHVINPLHFNVIFSNVCFLVLDPYWWTLKIIHWGGLGGGVERGFILHPLEWVTATVVLPVRQVTVPAGSLEYYNTYREIVGKNT